MTQHSGIIGFLGYGNMGEAIAAGLIRENITPPEQICVYDPSPERMAAAAAAGLTCAPSPVSMACNCETLILAVKPQSMAEALPPVTSIIRDNCLIISIVAGVPIAALKEFFNGQARIIRVMPNTPALVSAGAAALAYSENCNETDIAKALAIFSAVGVARGVPEAYLDAITALSGSGPAYYFYLTECLSAAAVAEGLPEDIAESFAAQTLTGAAQLLMSSGKKPSVLREQVTSKGGVTFAALETFRKHYFEDIVRDAFHAAVERSKELGKK